jgi:hypothetical protein
MEFVASFLNFDIGQTAILHLDQDIHDQKAALLGDSAISG